MIDILMRKWIKLVNNLKPQHYKGVRMLKLHLLDDVQHVILELQASRLRMSGMGVINYSIIKESSN